VASKEFSVRIGEEEIGRILNLKENLNLKELLMTYAPRYQQLGWVLVGMKSPEGTPLELDLSRPMETWSQELAELDVQDLQINLGIRTGRASNLLVLEVNKGEGALSLDQWGDWRADCVAEMGGCREQHYYSLAADSQMPPSHFLAPQVLIYGEGGLVLVPPSLEPQARESWHWLQPPWESPPQQPKPAVWQFLSEYIPGAMVTPEVLTWSEIYQAIAPHGCMLKALLVPPSSQEGYYQEILSTALALGFNDPAWLTALLWHAPHGHGRQNPDMRDYFQELVGKARSQRQESAPASKPPAMLPQPATAEPPAANPPPDVLEMFSGPGIFDPASDREGSTTPRFDKSVSGQFFQLLAGLGEKVIMESCRYESLLSGLKNKAGEIDSLVSQWEQFFPGSRPPGDPDQVPAEGSLEFGWETIINQGALKKQQLQEIQTAASAFLKQNPDLAADRHKVQMVIFCLRNYISINPEYAGLPFHEKLDRAGVMTRGFFRMRGP
jgi:hypothetical protein